MRVVRSSAVIAVFVAATSTSAQNAARVDSSGEVPGRLLSKLDADVAGLFRYEPTGLSLLSAHLDGTASEFLVSAGHMCQDNPAVIREVRRILVEHGVR